LRSAEDKIRRVARRWRGSEVRCANFTPISRGVGAFGPLPGTTADVTCAGEISVVLSIRSCPPPMEDYRRARPITTPFGLDDCDGPCDASIALVVSLVIVAMVTLLVGAVALD